MAALCQPGDDGVCVQCARQVPDGVRRTCPKRESHTHVPGRVVVARSDATPPNILRRLAMKCAATKRWKKAGKPTRSQEEVLAILDTCRACPHFRDTHCGLCGCPLNERIDEPTKNKIAMATERCPDAPPRWNNALANDAEI